MVASTHQALPSFCELMASLGLDAEPTSGPGVSGPGFRATRLHSRTSSTASTASSHSASSSYLVPKAPILKKQPSIIISQHGTGAEADFPRGRRNSTVSIASSRYAPYPTVERRGSVASLCSDLSAEDDGPTHLRSTSTSPKLSSTHVIGRKPSSLQLDKAARRRDRLSISSASEFAAAPISSLARRKSPTSSPIVTTFAAHSPSPPAQLSPVAIPMLPLLPAPSLAPFTFPARSDDDDNAATRSRARRRKSASPGAGRRPLPTGVRLSATHRYDPRTHRRQESAPVVPVA